MSTLISTVYGILLIAGGLMGFIKAHSKMSLLIGGISGFLVLLACNIGSKDPKAGYLFIATISMILSVLFLQRFVIHYAFFPAGFMLILSTTTCAVTALSYIKRKK